MSARILGFVVIGSMFTVSNLANGCRLVPADIDSRLGQREKLLPWVEFCAN